MSTESENSRKRKRSVEDSDQSEGEENDYDFTTKTWMTDAEFVLEGKSLHASKTVLGLFSPVFKAMFGTEFKEKEEKVIDLPEKKYEDFLEFLKCLYPNVLKTVNGENVEAVLVLANEYDVKLLVDKCEQVLHDKLSEETPTTEMLISTLNLVQRCNLDSIVDVIVRELALKDPSDVLNYFSSEEEMSVALPASVQNRILINKHHQLEKIQTDYVHMCFQIEDKNRPKVAGFENAHGGMIEFTIEDFNRLEYEERYDVSHSLWIMGLHFYLQSCFEDNDFWITLVCRNDDKIYPSGVTGWSCSVKAQLAIKDYHQLAANCFTDTRICTFTENDGRLDFKRLSLRHLRKVPAREDNRLETSVHFLVDNPLVNSVNTESG